MIKYGLLTIDDISEGDMLYYQCEVKFPNSYRSHQEDTMILIESIEDGKVSGTAMSGTMMGEEFEEVDVSKLCRVPND
jgi:hypothetical protein